VPIYVVAELLGVAKEDRDDFRRWSDVVIAAVEPKSEDERRKDAEQFAEMFAYFHEQAELRRRAPREDLLTLLVQAQVDGAALSSALVETLAKLILSAGNETTRSGIAGSALALAGHPAQRQVLVDSPELIEGAVNEFLRWTTPVRVFCRTATEDVRFGGRLIRQGDFVALSYVSANRDEEAWPDAGRLDVRREVNPMHLSFGHGPHICLGQTLARIEIKVVVEELLTRFPAFELAGDPVEIASTMVHGYDAMPMRLA
jgi:cytochrome P450